MLQLCKCKTCDLTGNWLLQDIADVEENITKKRVGVATSQKQVDKLLKEVSKAEKESLKVAAEMEEKEKDLKVCTCS